MYTNVYQRGNFLYVRGVEKGQRYNQKVEFNPTIWIQSKVSSATDKWQTLEGRTVYAVKPGSIRDCREFMDQYRDVHGMDIYETPGHMYQYISEKYTDDIIWDPNDISVFTIDIETETEYGFPDPESAQEVIQLITVKDTRHNQIVTFGLRPFDNNRNDVVYRYSSSEQSMLKEFMVWWQQNYPDVITGWNSSLFDTTYLYNRLVRVVGETLANKFSPWGQIRQTDVNLGGRTAQKTYVAGIAQLDYLDLYKKFGVYSAKESYKLDHIAQEELGVSKLPLPGDGSFKSTYSGVFDINSKPKDDDHPINKKAYQRTLMKRELQKRGLI